MSIFVALWSRDTERKLSDNIGTRWYYLEQAITAAYSEYGKAKAKHTFDAGIKDPVALHISAR